MVEGAGVMACDRAFSRWHTTPSGSGARTSVLALEQLEGDVAEESMVSVGHALWRILPAHGDNSHPTLMISGATTCLFPTV